jgi:hypothetical protein
MSLGSADLCLGFLASSLVPEQAVMMGPLLMAGLTDGPRTIAADPAAVPRLLSDLPSRGLFSLLVSARDPPQILRRQGLQLGVVAVEDLEPSLDAAFRLLRRDSRHVLQQHPETSLCVLLHLQINLQMRH